MILSGTATDGTLGLQAIKGADGITFAQDESAKYESMPRNAIAAGDVDFVLPPEKIAKELARIAEHPYVAAPAQAGSETEGTGIDIKDLEQDAFKKIMLLLRNHRGIDFTSYRPNTIRRRIMRRMVLAKISALGGYPTHLRNNASELETLYQDLLIAVTSFFRNPEAFPRVYMAAWAWVFLSCATSSRCTAELFGQRAREKGEGATFTVTLPIRALSDFPLGQEKRNTPEAQLEAPTTLAELTRLDGVRVLVVDDDADTRELLEVALRSSGAEVVTSLSAHYAVAEIKRQKPDCIVSDVGMPGEDGYGFMKKLRALNKKDGGKIPAIALTGFAGADHKSLADAAGY